MRAAIEQYVAREERCEREKAEDMERWQRYKLTSDAVPLETVEQWLSYWGGEDELPRPK